MKNLLSLFVAVTFLGAAQAFAGADCPKHRKAEAAKEAMKHDCGKHKAAGKKKAGHDCGDCPMHAKQGAQKKHSGNMCAGSTCPDKLKGAITSLKNIKSGVEQTITAKNPKIAAQIQELALVHYSPKAEKCPTCPRAIPGAKTSVKNIKGGILVTITGKDTASVKKIQAAAAAEHKGSHGTDAHAAKKHTAKKAKSYMCAMKCVKSPKPGKCPKCGMPMEEVK